MKIYLKYTFIKYIKFYFSILIIILNMNSVSVFSQDSLMTITPAKESSVLNYGIYAAYLFDIHSANFKELPQVPNCCYEYGNTNGHGFALGILGTIKLFENPVLVINANYENSKALFRRIESKLIGVNGIDYNGKIEHSINTSFTALTLNLSLAYNIYDNLNAYLGLAFAYRLNSNYIQKETLIEPDSVGAFENHSRVRNVSEGNILNANQFQPSIIVGINYDIPVNKKKSIFLTPELSYRYPLTRTIDGYDWKMHSVFLALALKFKTSDNQPDTTFNTFINIKAKDVDFNNEVKELSSILLEKKYSDGKEIKSNVFPEKIRFYPEISTLAKINHWDLSVYKDGKEIRKFSDISMFNSYIDWIIKDDTASIFTNTQSVKYKLTLYQEDNRIFNTEEKSINVNIKKTNLNSALNYTSFDNKENPVEQDTIVIEETISTNMRPLLNYVFFDFNSAKIPQRYEKINKEEKNNFRIENLRDLRTTDTYYKILNIIGRRLEENPDAAIILTGCNSDVGVEEGNIALSAMRADAVRRYLVNTWGISLQRIKIKSKNLPIVPSKTSEKEYQSDVRDENRRVEISADTFEIIKPVITFDTLRDIKPFKITFRPDIKSDTKLNHWRFTAKIDDFIMIDSSGYQDNPPAISLSIENHLKDFHRGTNKVDYEFTAETIDGLVSKATGTIPYKIRITDSTLDRYSLILFDFNSHKLSESNSIIAGYINNRITRNPYGQVSGSVEILGLSDLIGSQSHNQELSEMRAKSVAEFLNLRGHNVTINGIGEVSNLYHTELPEGRFYCRTVTITVKNPLKEQNK